VPAPAKQPSDDYRGVDSAVATSVKPTNASSFGATGYLGIMVKADKSGRPLVESVQLKSPAETAGIKVGDVIATVDKQVVTSPEAFRERIQVYPPDQPVAIGLLREGKPVDVSPRLIATSRPLRVATGPRPYLGIQLGEQKDGEPVKIGGVSADSPAATAGVKEGDVLLKLDSTDVNRANTLRDLLEEKRPGQELVVLVQRNGKELPPMTVKLTEDRTARGGGGGFSIQLWKKETMNVAVVGVEFTDIKHNDKLSAADLEKNLLGEGTPASPTLNGYFREISAGKFQFKGKMHSWVDVGKKRGDYSQGSGVSNKTAVMRDAVEKLLARDKEALKDADAVIFVYAGEEVRSNAGAVYYPHAGMVEVQRKRTLYLFVPEGGAKLASVSTFVKPACQLLGLPDLAARRENIGSEGCGPWCALSDATSGGKRLHLSPWAKERIGWLTPKVIDPGERQKLILAPIEGSQRECFKVLIRPDGSEYLLLENRKKQGFDSELPGEGLLIWRVVNDRPVLEESHGITGPTGPTVHLASVPYTSSANNAFTPSTIPSSRSPQGGGLPVHITNIKRQPDGRISFQIGREYE
jgi:membrane-associated protease RseP (regulator of RpoE activity)